MASASNEIEIHRPANEVYRFLADGLNNPKWRPAVLSIALESGTGGAAGAVYSQRLRGPFGSAVDGSYRLAEAVPDTRSRFQGLRRAAPPTRPFGPPPPQ